MCVAALLLNCLGGSALLAQSGQEAGRRGGWGHVAVAVGTADRVGDSYASRTGVGLSLALGGTASPRLLLGGEFGASVATGGSGSDYRGAGVTSWLLAIGRWYPAPAGSLFVLLGAGFGVEGEIADHGFLDGGLAGRAGVGVDFGKGTSLTPTFAVSMLKPTSGSCSVSQCYDFRLALELSVAVTWH